MFGNGAPGPWSNRPPVVVLANQKKSDMDAAVHEMLRDRGLQLEVHTREGNPFKMSDLRKVAASKASTIIVLHPESASSAANAEAIKAAAAMCLTALGPQPEQRVVVQMTGPSPEEQLLNSLGVTTRLVGRSAIQALELPDRQLMLRLVAQTAAQPGILTCWLDILALANNSAQFYCAELPAALQHKTYMEVRRSFAHAVLCGFRAPGGSVVLKLNPAESEVVPAGSMLIFLGRGGTPSLVVSNNSPLYDSAATSAAERLKRERTYRSQARNILVANWPVGAIPELMEGFSMFTPANSTITFTVVGEPSEAWPSRLGATKFNFISTLHPTSVKALLEAGIKTADAVVLGSGPTTAGAELEADARILAAVLQVQDAVLASKRRDAPHLVAPIRRYATSKLAAQYLEVLASEHAGSVQQQPAAAAAGPHAAHGPAPAAAGAGAAAGGHVSADGSTAVASKPVGLLAALVGGGGHASQGAAAAPPSQQQQQVMPAVICEPEFLVAQDVTSALMTQVVSDPAYADIMNALLFTSDGMELYLRNPASFNIPAGVPLSFAEVEEAVRLTRQTALGYIRGQTANCHHASSCNCSAPPKGSHKQQVRQRKVVLGPAASHTVTFGEADRIVVIAQDFKS